MIEKAVTMLVLIFFIIHGGVEVKDG